jgi:hypothetical protein
MKLRNTSVPLIPWRKLISRRIDQKIGLPPGALPSDSAKTQGITLGRSVRGSDAVTESTECTSVTVSRW